MMSDGLPNLEQEVPPNGGLDKDKKEDINAYTFVEWIDKALKSRSPMKWLVREYRLDSQLPVYRLYRKHRKDKGFTEVNFGRRSLLYYISVIIDLIFQLAYGLLRLLVYAAVFLIILRALQIPEYIIALLETQNN